MKQTSKQAGFGSAVVIGVLAVLILGGGAYFITSGNKMPENMNKKDVSQETSEEMEDKMMDDVSHETDTMMKDDPRMKEMSDEELAADGPNLDGYMLVDADAEIDGTFLPETQAGEYVEYTGDLSYAETGDVVLFFHADWCPSCRGLENDINANLGAIPDGISIQKLDYDTEAELKKKYGVVRQHTLIQVDESGNVIKTLTGLNNTLNQVVSQL